MARVGPLYSWALRGRFNAPPKIRHCLGLTRMGARLCHQKKVQGFKFFLQILTELSYLLKPQKTQIERLDQKLP